MQSSLKQWSTVKYVDRTKRVSEGRQRTLLVQNRPRHPTHSKSSHNLAFPAKTPNTWPSHWFPHSFGPRAGCWCLFCICTCHVRPLGYFSHLQVKGFIVFGSPVVALWLGCELPLLVTLMGPDHGDFNEWTEHAGRLPLQVIGCHNWKRESQPVLQ